MKDITAWAQALHERRGAWQGERALNEWNISSGHGFDEQNGTGSDHLPSHSLHTVLRAGEIDDDTFAFVSHFDPANHHAGPPSDGNASGCAWHRTLLLLWADNTQMLEWCRPILRPLLAGMPYAASATATAGPRDSRWFRIRCIDLGSVARPSLSKWLLSHDRGGSIIAVGDEEWRQMLSSFLATRLDLYAARLIVLRAAHTPHGRSLRLLECPSRPSAHDLAIVSASPAVEASPRPPDCAGTQQSSLFD